MPNAKSSRGRGSNVVQLINRQPYTPHQYVRAPVRKLSIDRILSDIKSARCGSEEWRTLQVFAAQQFAALNGWNKARSSFRLEDIGKHHCRVDCFEKEAILDHCLYLRGGPIGDRKCAAIATQPYGHVSEGYAEAIGARYKIECHIPPFPAASIYNPGECLFIVYTAPGTEVRWLPEQVTGLAVQS